MRATLFGLLGLAIIASMPVTPAAAASDLNTKCRAKAKESVGGDTYRQARRATAVYNSCMSSGGKG
jgi:hypothetical protein